MDGSSNKTAIYLTDEDVQRFQKFLKHYDFFTYLLDNDVLTMKGGKFILHFDQDGNFKGISIDKWLYKN